MLVRGAPGSTLRTAIDRRCVDKALVLRSGQRPSESQLRSPLVMSRPGDSRRVVARRPDTASPLTSTPSASCSSSTTAEHASRSVTPSSTPAPATIVAPTDIPHAFTNAGAAPLDMLDLYQHGREVDLTTTQVFWAHQPTVGYGIGPKQLSQHYCYLDVRVEHVNIGSNHGLAVPDPDGMLRGTGAWFRHRRVESLDELDHPAMRSILVAAVEQRRAAD